MKRFSITIILLLSFVQIYANSTPKGINNALDTCTKPDAGPNQWLTCQPYTPPITSTFLSARAAAGGRWTQISIRPDIPPAQIEEPTSTTTKVTNLVDLIIYKFVWTSGSGCSDTMEVFINCDQFCVKPNAGPDIAIIPPTTTVDLPDAQKGQKWTAWALNPPFTVVHPTTGTVNGITIANVLYLYILRDTLLSCSDTVAVFKMSIDYPDQTICRDTVSVSLPKIGETWSFLSGPAAAVISPSGKITGMAQLGVYKFRIANAYVADTVKFTRVSDCNSVMTDLHLDKSISTTYAKVGDVITYTLKLWNEGSVLVNGIQVKDALSSGLQYLGNTALTGTYNPQIKRWSIDNLAVGDTARLTISAKVIKPGVEYITAEIIKATQPDVDSTPDNGLYEEDDITRGCISTPIDLCINKTFELSVPASYTNVTWHRDGFQVGSGNTYTATQTGAYTFRADNHSSICLTGGCCPFYVILGDCCPNIICTPSTFVIKKK